MAKTERKQEGANKIDVSVSFANKQGFTFGIRGTTWRFASDNVGDDMHRRISRVFHSFVERPTLKISPEAKFNQIQNLCNRCADLSDFLKRFTEHNIYHMPNLSVTDVDLPPPQKAQPAPKVKVKAERKRGNLAPAFQPKYTYPADIVTPEQKKKYRAMSRAAAKKDKK